MCTSIDYAKIKLVIWDLDETFWKGVLSEQSVIFQEENARLIKNMTDAGVINSICSKNDAAAVQEIMEFHGIWDLFVFNSINWSSKGDRVRQIVTSMNLRFPNVLFIDDNETNLGEVQASCPGIMVSNADVISGLIDHYEQAEKKDHLHQRLQQYKVLEEKQNFKAVAGSNEEFLKYCDIHVDIRYDCKDHMDRILDLVQRSNQLNFTKIRSSCEELSTLMEDDAITSGYVEVHDRFGDYGIVGFFAIKEHRLIHFVFSCRILNMGIEQFVFHKIGKPELKIVEPVSSSLDMPCPDWINVVEQDKGEGKNLHKETLRNNKIVIKGPCDMQQIFSFIKDSKNIKTEFVYVNSRGVSIEQGCHTTHIVEGRTLSKDIQDHLIKTLPFGDKGMFYSEIFDNDVGFVILSMLTDPNLGLYRERATGAVVAFGEYINDLTDERLWKAILQKEVFTANCDFSEKDLMDFRDRFEYIGRIRPEEVLDHLDFIYENIGTDTQLILCLGSEKQYLAETKQAYLDRHIYHQELNALIRKWSMNRERVHLVDSTRFIETQDDYTNNINHYSKRTYYQMSQELIEIINSTNKGDVIIRTASAADQRLSGLIAKGKRAPGFVLRKIRKALKH